LKAEHKETKNPVSQRLIELLGINVEDEREAEDNLKIPNS